MNVARALEERGALLKGHFKLTSGKHSDTYVEKARVFEDPPLVARLGTEIASWYEGVEAVVSPAVGAIPLGFAAALAAPARFLFAEREGGRFVLRRGFRLREGERALVVEDVITTGGSASEVVELVRGSGAEGLGVAALVDRSAGELPFSLRAAVRVEAEVWDPEACPLCSRAVPVEAPGSHYL